MVNQKMVTAVVDGIEILNTTPHELTFQSKDGSVASVPPCGRLVNAKTIEEVVGAGPGGVQMVRTRFHRDEETLEWLTRLRKDQVGLVVAGSIIAAQAYPGLVFGLTPAPGFERAAPADKRMNPAKWNTF